MDKVLQEVVPILVLCGVVALVVTLLPKGGAPPTTPEFRRRRVLNWLPLGLTYAFLYMGRYNLNGLMDAKLISHSDFGDIDAVGSIVYGLSFLLNGPLTDKLGGRFTILVAAGGAGVCNAAIGIIMWRSGAPPSVLALQVLYGLNMYFQSFGAVAIVKVNASWFHLRERGTFAGIFGILISIGLYLAYDWAPKIASLASEPWLFLAPAIALGVFLVLSALFVYDTPADVGLPTFDVADASSGDDSPQSLWSVIGKILSNRVLLVIALISLCGGFLRQAVLKWWRVFASGVGVDSFVTHHWGMVSCIAGITGGMFAGILSDHLFQSRRPPVATLLLCFVLAGAVAILALLSIPSAISFVVAFMAMSVIGINGMLSGVASQDFGGRRAAGTATGLIDGFVYFGSALQGLIYGRLLPEANDPASSDPQSWRAWPLAMIPAAVIGIALSLTVYNARVASKKSSAH